MFLPPSRQKFYSAWLGGEKRGKFTSLPPTMTRIICSFEYAERGELRSNWRRRRKTFLHKVASIFNHDWGEDGNFQSSLIGKFHNLAWLRKNFWSSSGGKPADLCKTLAGFDLHHIERINSHSSIFIDWKKIAKARLKAEIYSIVQPW